MGMAERESWLEKSGVRPALSATSRQTWLTAAREGRGRAGRGRNWPYSDLIVPFGRIVVTDAFWTVISVPSEISTPT